MDALFGQWSLSDSRKQGTDWKLGRVCDLEYAGRPVATLLAAYGEVLLRDVLAAIEGGALDLIGGALSFGEWSFCQGQVSRGCLVKVSNVFFGEVHVMKLTAATAERFGQDLQGVAGDRVRERQLRAEGV